MVNDFPFILTLDSNCVAVALVIRLSLAHTASSASVSILSRFLSSRSTCDWDESTLLFIHQINYSMGTRITLFNLRNLHQIDSLRTRLLALIEVA